MPDLITAGDLLVQEGTNLPGSLALQPEVDSNGWAAVKDNRFTFEKAVHKAGWTFFSPANRMLRSGTRFTDST